MNTGQKDSVSFSELQPMGVGILNSSMNEGVLTLTFEDHICSCLGLSLLDINPFFILYLNVSLSPLHQR